MYVVCRKGHLVYYWDGNVHIFLEKEAGIFPSRRDCLEYLQQCGHTKERAVEIVKVMQKTPATWISV